MLRTNLAGVKPNAALKQNATVKPNSTTNTGKVKVGTSETQFGSEDELRANGKPGDFTLVAYRKGSQEELRYRIVYIRGDGHLASRCISGDEFNSLSGFNGRYLE